MKHTTSKVAKYYSDQHEVQIPTVRADCNHTFGCFAVVLPNANFDTEGMRTVTEKENELTTRYMKELAQHLYYHMSCYDLRMLRDELNALRL